MPAANRRPVRPAFVALALSIALMGAAASFIAGLLQRHRWIAYVGLAIILYVALRMIWEGTFEVHEAIAFGVVLPVWVSLPAAAVLTEVWAVAELWALGELWALAEFWVTEAGAVIEVAELELHARRARPAIAG